MSRRRLGVRSGALILASHQIPQRFRGGGKSTFAFCKSPPHPCLGPTAFRFNDYDHGAAVFHHACKMGLEGIVSKRKHSLYRSGRSSDWLKMKNPACAAVKREAEEDWGR